MTTIVMKSGKVFRDVRLSRFGEQLVIVYATRKDVQGDELVKMVAGGEVYSFKERGEDEWRICFNTSEVEGVK